ncbi:TetR/AcrR family transcriptional regulator [Vibrio olivae]|uniref:TetR/AcrR family transcriptional regulator n=1 Tax=Vibrio olivae TaxID=1243002 RepID=A0ABV5HS11_9VIBR
MNKTQQKIAAGLERAFAEHGFTELGVDGLRLAADVSLRTLYKYCPSKEAMIIMALEHRHSRYLAYLFEGLSGNRQQIADELLNRVGRWMDESVSEGCLFHNAVVSYPHSEPIRNLLEQHKTDVTEKMATVTQLVERRSTLLLIHEGIVQSWPILGVTAIESAKALLIPLLSETD